MQTTSIEDLERERREAAAHTEALIREASAARRAFERTPTYRIESGRALARWMAAESNVDGAIAAEKLIDGRIWEALNPETA